MTALAEHSVRARLVLLLALFITGSLLVVEVIGGILTNSLALLADGGHMASDVGALTFSLLAVWLATRPATPGRTYGFHRAEVLAAFVNSLALAGIAAYIFWEAGRRFSEAPDVHAGPMLGIALLGLFGNLAAASLLAGPSRRSLNVRSAFLHVLGDTLASFGVIFAGILILLTGETLFDPAIGIAIGILILLSSFRIIWEATQVLLEAAPPGIRTEDVQKQMLATPGVQNVHDLHIWTVTSGFVSLSAHVETDMGREHHDILVDLRRLLSLSFGIDHATLQLETADLHEELEACCGVDTREPPHRHAVYHA